MKRTRKQTTVFGADDKVIFLSGTILNFLLEQQDSDLIALYTFYCYTARCQKTDELKFLTKDTATIIGWSPDKVRKVKNTLRELGLIEDVKLYDDDGKVVDYLIKIPNSLEHLLLSENDTVYNNIRININHNILDPPSNNFITSPMFEKFWRAYPKKVDKGKALSKWNYICNKKGDRPTWKQIKTAILQQLKTERWKDPKYIPNPTTWLNQSRWLDDPKEMTSYNRGENKLPIYDDGRKYIWDEKLGRYKHCRTGEIYIP